jgi:GT2 family glycosyltransferase
MTTDSRTEPGQPVPRQELGAQPGNPLVSIVIPTRGRRQELGRLLSSLTAQDCVGQLEVIVVDNPVAFNREWLRAVSWPFPVGYVHITQANRGVGRNAGAAVAAGRWLLFLDSDIVLSPTAVSTLINSAVDLKRTIVMADVVFPPDRPRTLATHLLDVPAYFRRYRRVRRSGKLTFLEFVSCCFLISSDDFAELDGFDSGFVHYGYEDVEFAFRAEQRGTEVALSTARAYHHKHLDAVTALRRAKEVGRSAVHLVDLHPEIESVLPLGVANTINGTLPRREPFDIDAAIAYVDSMEQAWAGLRSHGQLTGLRVLIEEARHCYGEIHRYGHLSGVATELSDRKGAVA